MAADLITPADYYALTNTPTPDTGTTAEVAAAITGASNAIRMYTDRDFTLEADASQIPRTFKYVGGYLEIDDCQSVTSVSIAVTPWNTVGRMLDPTEWDSGASNRQLDVLDYIELMVRTYRGGSPAMGFQWNADQYGYGYGYTNYGPPSYTVDAVWGWPSIPDEIKYAMVWIMGEFMSDPEPYNSESIENYSHVVSASRSGAGAPIVAIPVRAASLLDPYMRINV